MKQGIKVQKFHQWEEAKCKGLNFSSTEFELNSDGYVFSDELFILHIAEYCVIPEELILDNQLGVIYFRKSSSQFKLPYQIHTIYSLSIHL